MFHLPIAMMCVCVCAPQHIPFIWDPLTAQSGGKFNALQCTNKRQMIQPKYSVIYIVTFVSLLSRAIRFLRYSAGTESKAGDWGNKSTHTPTVTMWLCGSLNMRCANILIYIFAFNGSTNVWHPSVFISRLRDQTVKKTQTHIHIPFSISFRCSHKKNSSNWAEYICDAYIHLFITYR